MKNAAVVPVMIELHRRLRGGASLAGALRDARHAAESDLVADATGWSFISLGTG